MKKEFTNVFITFSLIAVMISGSSYIYEKMINADIEAEKIYEEKKVREEEQLAFRQEEEAKEMLREQEELIAKEKIKIEKKKQEKNNLKP